MTLRAMNTAAQALLARALAGERIPVVPLVEILTPVVQRWALCGHALTWAGNEWVPQDLLLGDVEDAISGLNDITLTLPGITPGQLAFAFEDLDGTKARIYDAWVDPATMAVADAVRVFSGEVDLPGWQEGAESSVILTFVHRGRAALRGKPSLYSADEQRRLYSGDTALDRDPGTDQAPIVWPAASYFKQG